MKGLPKDKRYKFTYPRESSQKSENAGYILWKDSKIVVFYANCLQSTPSARLLVGTSDEAIKCVHGLSCLERWTGDETMNRTKFMVPAIIVAYNCCMNGVDCADQMRSINQCKRKEKRLYMNLFTYFLDLGLVNTFGLYSQGAKLSAGYAFHNFKRDICEQLVTPYKEERLKKKNIVAKKAGYLPS